MGGVLSCGFVFCRKFERLVVEVVGLFVRRMWGMSVGEGDLSGEFALSSMLETDVSEEKEKRMKKEKGGKREVGVDEVGEKGEERRGEEFCEGDWREGEG